MTETVHAAHVDEETVIGDIGDGAGDDLSFLQQRAHLLAHLVALLFQDGAPGDNHVVPFTVKLQDLKFKTLADQAVQVLDRTKIDLRIRQEGRNADIDGHAALDPAFDLAFDGFIVFLDFGNVFPYFDRNRFFP